MSVHIHSNAFTSITYPKKKLNIFLHIPLYIPVMAIAVEYQQAKTENIPKV